MCIRDRDIAGQQALVHRHVQDDLGGIIQLAYLGADPVSYTHLNANLRIELAQYKDMESFAQFSSDLDAETRRQLDHGKALMEMLKQPLYQPKSDAEQVDRKSTRLNSSHEIPSRMPSSA